MRTIVTKAMRDSLRAGITDALDYAESVHRGLDSITSESVGLAGDDFAEVQRLAETAYNALAKARILTDGEASIAVPDEPVTARLMSPEEVAVLNAARTVLKDLEYRAGHYYGLSGHAVFSRGRVAEVADQAGEGLVSVLSVVATWGGMPLSDDELHNRVQA